MLGVISGNSSKLNVREWYSMAGNLKKKLRVGALLPSGINQSITVIR